MPVCAYAAGSIEVTDAHVPASDATGVDVPLLMTLNNQADAPDALLRVRCPFANFSERHTVDYGEGAPAMRAVPSIPLAAGAKTALSTKAFHVMLLQTRVKLTPGDKLICSVAFKNAAAQDIQVTVATPP